MFKSTPSFANFFFQKLYCFFTWLRAFSTENWISYLTALCSFSPAVDGLYVDLYMLHFASAQPGKSLKVLRPLLPSCTRDECLQASSKFRFSSRFNPPSTPQSSVNNGLTFDLKGLYHLCCCRSNN